MPDDETATTSLDKLLKAPPKPPPEFKGRVVRGVGSQLWRAYLDRRSTWVEAVLAADGTVEQASAALAKVDHPISHHALRTLRRSKGLVAPKAPKTPKPGKVAKVEVDAIAALMHDLIAKHVAPLHAELARLQKIEKKYNGLKKLMGEDKQ